MSRFDAFGRRFARYHFARNYQTLMAKANDLNKGFAREKKPSETLADRYRMRLLDAMMCRASRVVWGWLRNCH
tara:strand:+ start:791 stop:1009 length:219 start_codon:yes stop_codon:yes gene_type:complete